MGPVKSARLLDFLTRQGFSPAVAAGLMLDGKVHLLGREDKPMHQAKDPGISALAGDRISIELHIKDAQAGIKAGVIQPEQIRPSSRSNHELLIWTIGQADCHIAVGLHREDETKEIQKRQERLDFKDVTPLDFTSLERRFLREKYGQRRGRRMVHGKEPLPKDAFAGLRPPKRQPIRIETSELQTDLDLSDCWRKAMSAQDKNEDDAAISSYKKALELDKSKRRIAIIFYNTGIALGNLQKYHEALESYSKALELDASRSEAINNIAFIHNHLSSLADAQGDSNLAEYHHQQAAIYWKKAVEINPGKYLEAKTWLETNHHIQSQDKYITLTTNSAERTKMTRSADRPTNMSLKDAYIFFWKHAFQFKGKISRRNFWITVLANAIAFTIIALLVAFFSTLVGSEISPAWGALLTIYALGTGAASVTLQLRRIRDTGLSPWLMLILFVPYIGSIITLVFYMLPSKYQSPIRSTQNPIAKHNRDIINSSNTTTSPKAPDDELADLAIHQKELEASLKKIRDKDNTN